MIFWIYADLTWHSWCQQKKFFGCILSHYTCVKWYFRSMQIWLDIVDPRCQNFTDAFHHVTPQPFNQSASSHSRHNKNHVLPKRSTTLKSITCSWIFFGRWWGHVQNNAHICNSQSGGWDPRVHQFVQSSRDAHGGRNHYEKSQKWSWSFDWHLESEKADYQLSTILVYLLFTFKGIKQFHFGYYEKNGCRALTIDHKVKKSVTDLPPSPPPPKFWV